MTARNMTKSEILKSIKAKCLDCCCDSLSEVKLCPAKTCPLYQFRLGKDEKRVKRVLSEEERLMRVESMRRARNVRKSPCA